MTLVSLIYISRHSYFAQCRYDIDFHRILVNRVSYFILGCSRKEVPDSVEEGSTETDGMEAGNSADDNEREGHTASGKRKARNKEFAVPDVKRRKTSNISTDINIKKKTVKCDKNLTETSGIVVNKSKKSFPVCVNVDSKVQDKVLGESEAFESKEKLLDGPKTVVEKSTKSKVAPITHSPVEGRSSRITRNVRTPNWKNVLSGKVSLRDAYNEKKSNANEKTVTMIIPNTPEKIPDKDPRQNVRNKVIKGSEVIVIENKSKDHTKKRTNSKSDRLLYQNDKKEVHERIKENIVTSKKDKNVASQVKQCSVNLIAVDSKETQKDDVSVTGSDKNGLAKADGNDDKGLKTSMRNTSFEVSAKKQHYNKKHRDIGSKNKVLSEQTADEKNVFCQQKQSQENSVIETFKQSKEKLMPDKNSIESSLVNSLSASKSMSEKEPELTKKRAKGRPKGSKNKTQEDDDDEFEAAVEVFNYTGYSGRPKLTSVRVKIEPEEINTKTEPKNTETEKYPKRKSKKSTAFDSVSIDEIHLSDEEDILEWKGVGEMKNRGRGRPKGSFLKKYEIITQPLEFEAKGHGTPKAGLPSLLEEDTGIGLRSSSRIKSYLCEICAESFSLKYLLDEHYQKDHPNDNVKSEPETEQVEKRGRKRKNIYKDDEEQTKEIKANSSGGTDEEDKYANGMVGIDDKDLDSGDDYQEEDDKAWEMSDEETDDIDDDDDQDDHPAEQTKSNKKCTLKVENKTGDYSCPECSQKFKSLISLQVHKIVHMKKELTFECVTCKQKFLTQKDLQIHSQKAHTADYGTLLYFGFVVRDGKIQCEICFKDFETMDSYHDHRPTHLSLKHHCRNCGKCFVTNDELETHCQSKCVEDENHLQCEACLKQFNSNESRKKHIMEKHSENHEFCCHLCGLGKDSLNSLKEHISGHTMEKIFRCEICAKQFFDKKNLLDHRLTHTRLEEVECLTCFKKFGNQKSLQLHMHRHTMKKKIHCRFCDMKFDTKEASLEHEITHKENEENQLLELVHKCGDCGRTFSNKQRLQRHAQVHFEEQCFRCIFCEEKFQNGSALLAHKKKKHPYEYKTKKVPKVMICEHCGFETSHKQRLERHLQVHNTEKLFECEYCGKKFQTLTSCSSHKMIHRGRIRNPGKKFICQWALCKKEYIKPATLRRHLNSHLFKVVSGREDCDCQECAVRKTGGTIHGSSVDNLEQIGSEVVLGGTASDKALMRDSYRESSNKNTDTVLLKPKPSIDILQEAISQIEEAENEEGQREATNDNAGAVMEELDIKIKPVFPCPWCPQVYSFRCKLVDHFSKVHEKLKFPTCEECNKVYLDKKNLKEHMTVHSGVKSYQCEVCEKVFRTKTSLRQHSHIHSENKPFVCSYCGHGFAQRGYYLEHVRRHTGERPYSCHVCQKTFLSNELRKRHMYTHTGDKPHQCSECGKSFIDKSQLIVHLRTHINYRPFQCGRCDKAFYANSKLQRHLATVHHIDKRTLSDYFPTKINKGLGWRHKNKANKEKIKPDTEYVVYIDQHGNIISRVQTRAMEQQPIAPNIKEQASDEIVDGETQIQEELEAELEEEEKEQVIKEEKEETTLQNIQILNKPEQRFIPLESAIEVHTRRDASGQLQIYTVPQGKKPVHQETEAEFTAEELAVVNVSEMHEAVEVFQMVTNDVNPDSVEVVQVEDKSHSELIQMADDNGSVVEEGEQYTALVENDQTDVKHIELIQTVPEQEAISNQEAIEILAGISGGPDEQGAVLADQNIQIQTIQFAEPQHETHIGNVEQIAQDISINIGEDGSVNQADLEKIEALRNLYSDQQIVIVLENETQQ